LRQSYLHLNQAVAISSRLFVEKVSTICVKQMRHHHHLHVPHPHHLPLRRPRLVAAVAEEISHLRSLLRFWKEIRSWGIATTRRKRKIGIR
jgi:hypothetical protein